MVKKYINGEIHCILRVKGQRFNFIACNEQEVIEIAEIINNYLN